MVRRRFAFSPQLSDRQVRTEDAAAKTQRRARTLPHLSIGVAARAALLLLQVPGAATASHAKSMGLVVALAKALGSLGLTTGSGNESGGGRDGVPSRGPEAEKGVVGLAVGLDPPKISGGQRNCARIGLLFL